MGKLKNILGERFGRLTVIGRDQNSKYGSSKWICSCDCGEYCSIRGSSLISNSSGSCGCLQIKLVKERSTTHGMKSTQSYATWRGIYNRCNNQNDPGYKYYGGRGIKRCKRWDKFENFLEDMGEKPSNLSLDRIDNDGDYCKQNCRWATRDEQANNTSRNRIIEVNGEKYTIAQLARKIGVNYNTLQHRIYKNKPIDDLIENLEEK